MAKKAPGQYDGGVTVPPEWDVVVVKLDPNDAETKGEIWLTLPQADALILSLQNARAKIQRRAMERLRVPPELVAK